jgi:hypothetical protein
VISAKESKPVIENCWYSSTSTYPLLEVGGYQYGLYCWLTQHFSEA